jgi:hypothetical protein
MKSLNWLCFYILVWRVFAEENLPFVGDKVYDGIWHSLENISITNQTVNNIAIISGHQVTNERMLMKKYNFKNQKNGHSRALLDGTNMLINLYDGSRFNKILQIIFEINTYVLPLTFE